MSSYSGLQKHEKEVAEAGPSGSSGKNRKRKRNDPGPEAIKKACEWCVKAVLRFRLVPF